MTMTLLVFGAVLFGLIVGIAVAARAQRRRFTRYQGESFPCRIRWPNRGMRRKRPLWLPGRARARWIHSVLLVQRGRLVPTTLALPVRLPEDAIREASLNVRSLGRRPLTIRLWLDDGSLVEIAARSRDRTLLAGPFLAAAVVSLGPRRE